jgi:hypothetical protein
MRIRKEKEMDWWRKGTEAVGKEKDERRRRKVCFGVKGREAGKCYWIVEERKGMKKVNWGVDEGEIGKVNLGVDEGEIWNKSLGVDEGKIGQGKRVIDAKEIGKVNRGVDEGELGSKLGS